MTLERHNATTSPDWERGDLLGESFPAHIAALRDGGAEFLTRAFRAAGSLPADNRVARITHWEAVTGGSTGCKLRLSVAYERPDPQLHTALFAKFSRDFSDELRDRGRFQMAREVRFALLSRAPEFPLTVPRCYFADYHADSGTGLLITEAVAFGVAPVEPHRGKCFDDTLPDALDHYRAIVRALARLAGSHRGGRLPSQIDAEFPYAPAALAVSRRAAYGPAEVAARITSYAAFARAYPRLVPAPLREADFLARLADEAPRFIACAAQAEAELAAQPGYIALCHWNANIDNAWFWRAASGDLQCGLMDWGNVGQMNVAMALWGCLCAAEPALWERHLDGLLALFAGEFAGTGGGMLDVAVLKRHLSLYAASMGLTWLLDAPATLRARLGDPARLSGRDDPRLRADERAHVQLHMLTVLLGLWERTDFDGIIRQLELAAN